jgi:carboxyl-terminal processing protease
MKTTQIPKSRFRSKSARVLATVVFLFSSVFFYGFSRHDDVLFKVGKGIDLFGSIYKELSFSYVDELDPIILMKAGIKGMLSAIDPYTVYIDEQDKSDVDILTTGQYGGLGISVRKHKGRFIVMNILETVRDQTQLHIGDEILVVDGVDLQKERTAELKNLLRGKPGTFVEMKVNRLGISSDLDLSVQRRRIHLNNVSYSSVLHDSIAYIKLDRFSRRAGADVRNALNKLRESSEIKAVIMDVRNNPGGLLDAAVNVSEKFLPEGSLIVSTKGRKKNYDRSYYCSESPILRSEPLIILVNGNSASASEILAGAIQDNDRGLIVGTRSFGKGLVQNVIPLSYNSSLKITTSKYYTPSGRCIQKIDYSKRNANKLFLSHDDDTAKTFTTLLLHRGVKESGGINPDYTVEAATADKYVRHLRNELLLFEFVTRALNTQIVTTNSPSDPDLKRHFKAFMDTVETDSSYEVRKAFDKLNDLAKSYGYTENEIKKLSSLSKIYTRRPVNSVTRKWDKISKEIRIEILNRTEGSSSRRSYLIPQDRQLQAALDILTTRDTYLATFNITEN